MKDNMMVQVQPKAGIVKRVPMTVSEDSTNQKYLMTALTKLYTRPGEAIFRETVTNAYDSHRRAGQSDPIEVSYRLVSRSNPLHAQQTFNSKVTTFVVLTVQDYGVGMSFDDIENLYSKYGESTKQSDNTEVGFFGLGAKAGIALADEVVIHAVKDGVFTDAKMFTDKFGSSFIDILDSGPSTERDSVRVSMEFETSEGLTDFFNNFFKTWASGTVLLNGKQPHLLRNDDDYQLMDSVNGEVSGWLFVKQFTGFDKSLLVNQNTVMQVAVGPVIYPITFNEAQEFLGFSSDTFGLLSKSVVVLPVGSVKLTAPREGFLWSEETVEALKEAFAGFVELADGFYTSHVDGLSEGDAVKFFAVNKKRLLMFGTLNKALDTVEDSAGAFRKSLDADAVVLWHGENLNEDTVFPSTTSYEYSVQSNGANTSYVKNYSSYGVDKDYFVFTAGADDVKESWFIRNVKHFSAANMSNDGVTVPKFIFMDSPPQGRWAKYWAKYLTKEEFLAAAKAYVLQQKADKGPRQVSYPVYDPASKTLSSVPVGDIADDALYVGNLEGILYGGVTNRIVEALKKDPLYPDDKLDALLRSTNWFLLSETLELLGLSTRQIVLLHDRKPSVLVKSKPGARSISSVLYDYFQGLSDRSKRFVVMQAFGMHYYLKRDHAIFIRNVKKLSYCSNVITNDFILEMISFFSENDRRRLSFFKLLASNVFFWAKNDDYPETLNVFFEPENNLYCVAPFMMSHVWNPDHMVKYVNGVNEFPERLGYADVFSATKFGNTRSSPLQWGDFTWDKDKESE